MLISKKNISGKKTFFLLLALWFIINLLQATFTGMSSDEAYYVLWGKQLDSELIFRYEYKAQP